MTTTIPIVSAYCGDPVADGLVDSLSQPGGNVTGAAFIGSALLAKRMELIREIVPDATDVALQSTPEAAKEWTFSEVAVGLEGDVIETPLMR